MPCLPRRSVPHPGVALRSSVIFLKLCNGFRVAVIVALLKVTKVMKAIKDCSLTSITCHWSYTVIRYSGNRNYLYAPRREVARRADF